MSFRRIDLRSSAHAWTAEHPATPAGYRRVQGRERRSKIDAAIPGNGSYQSVRDAVCSR